MYIFRGKSNGSQEVKNLLFLQCLKLGELDCGIYSVAHIKICYCQISATIQ